MRPFSPLLVAAMLLAAGCSKAPEYELRGQVLAVDAGRQELTIKHEDIKGFMPSMTMPFKVRQASLLEGRVPGDLVKATLVVEESDAYLKEVERTGHAALTEKPPMRPPAIIAPGTEVRDVEMIDQAGRPRRLSEWRGRVVAVTFIYTRCPLPNFCPLMDRHFAAVQRAVQEDAALRGRTQLVSMSFDPKFDTPAVLAAHAARLDADPATWTFVTGERDAIEAFAGQFGVAIMREDPTEAEILHNLRTAVIDRNGRLAEMFNGNEWTPAELLAALRRAGG